MKLNEIKQINEGAIYNTVEYDLSSEDQKRYAFLAKAPQLKPEEILNMYGVDYPFEPLRVKLNNGEDLRVEVDFAPMATWVSIKGYKAKYTKDPATGKNAEVYMVKGSNPSQVRAKYFWARDVKDQVAGINDIVRAAYGEYYEQFRKKLQFELRDKLAPAAKEALDDNLLELINNKEHEKIRKWFVDHGFTMTNGGELPAAEDFKKMSNLIGWNVRTSNRYRAAEGTDIKINWDDKTFYYQGWSSDD